MPRYQRAIVIASLCFFLNFFSGAQERQHNLDLHGSIAEENTYRNPALGMTIRLPGSWQLLQSGTPTPNDPTCTGPLCGPPDINAVLETKPESQPAYRLYLSGWKLSQEYLNRSRYPLKWFADIMLKGSLDPNLVPMEKQTSIQLDGKPAFRLLTAGRGEKNPRVLGYVSESNGYVFLLVSAAPRDPQPMQSAIETLKFR